jgi:hypothetical protein
MLELVTNLATSIGGMVVWFCSNCLEMSRHDAIASFGRDARDAANQRHSESWKAPPSPCVLTKMLVVLVMPGDLGCRTVRLLFGGCFGLVVRPFVQALA